MQSADLLHYRPLLGALSSSVGLTVMPTQVLGMDYVARCSYVLRTPCPIRPVVPRSRRRRNLRQSIPTERRRPDHCKQWSEDVASIGFEDV